MHLESHGFSPHHHYHPGPSHPSLTWKMAITPNWAPIFPLGPWRVLSPHCKQWSFSYTNPDHIYVMPLVNTPTASQHTLKKTLLPLWLIHPLFQTRCPSYWRYTLILGPLHFGPTRNATLPGIWTAHSQTSHRSLLKHHHIRRSFSDHPT